MKYRYHLIIENTKEDEKILEIEGFGATRNIKTCLKSIRRDINSSIKEKLDHIDEKEQLEAFAKELTDATE